MSNALLASLGERARAILKSFDKKEEEEAVPVAPEDPDALPTDPRVAGADASPKESDLEEAGESQAAAAPAPGEEGAPGPDGGAPPPADGDEDEDDEGRPVAKSFDEFGNADLDPEEMRSLLKAYGVTPATDENAIAHGGVDVESILEAILQGMEHQTAELATLKKEIARLRSSNAENQRSITKALDSLADPRTAPAAPSRAITKSLAAPVNTPTGETEAAFSTRLFTEVKAGRMSAGQAQAEAREFKNTPRP